MLFEGSIQRLRKNSLRAGFRQEAKDIPVIYRRGGSFKISPSRQQNSHRVGRGFLDPAQELVAVHSWHPQIRYHYCISMVAHCIEGILRTPGNLDAVLPV